MSEPEIHPGCFGVASVFALDCDTCRACPSFDPCRERSHETLMAIKGRVNVEDILRRHQKARIEAEADRKARAAAAPAPTPAPQPAPVTAPVERKTPAEQVKFDVSAHDQATINRITNVKVKEVATSLARNNQLEFIRVMLRAGKNPFVKLGKYPNMQVAADMLLAGGFTKAALAQRYCRELGWTEETAASQRAQALRMFEALGVVREFNGAIVLHIQ